MSVLGLARLSANIWEWFDRLQYTSSNTAVHQVAPQLALAIEWPECRDQYNATVLQ